MCFCVFQWLFTTSNKVFPFPFQLRVNFNTQLWIDKIKVGKSVSIIMQNRALQPNLLFDVYTSKK